MTHNTCRLKANSTKSRRFEEEHRRRSLTTGCHTILSGTAESDLIIRTNSIQTTKCLTPSHLGGSRLNQNCRYILKWTMKTTLIMITQNSRRILDIKLSTHPNPSRLESPSVCARSARRPAACISSTRDTTYSDTVMTGLPYPLTN